MDPFAALAAQIDVPEAVDPTVLAWWLDRAREAPRRPFHGEPQLRRIAEQLDAGLSSMQVIGQLRGRSRLGQAQARPRRQRETLLSGGRRGSLT